MQGVLDTLYGMKGDQFRYAKTADGVPFLPCIALTGNHCVLLNWTKGKRKFSYYSFRIALEEAANLLRESPEQLVVSPKRSGKMKKVLAADKSRVLREHQKKRITKNYAVDPEVRFRNHWNFLVRTTIKEVAFDLPMTHVTDKEVTLYCMKARLGALDDPQPPRPESQLAVLALASLQKGKHPHFYRKVGEKTITVYEQRSELVE